MGHTAGGGIWIGDCEPCGERDESITPLQGAFQTFQSQERFAVAAGQGHRLLAPFRTARGLRQTGLWSSRTLGPDDPLTSTMDTNLYAAVVSSLWRHKRLTP